MLFSSCLNTTNGEVTKLYELAIGGTATSVNADVIYDGGDWGPVVAANTAAGSLLCLEGQTLMFLGVWMSYRWTWTG
jgi:hypothetical protein